MIEINPDRNKTKEVKTNEIGKEDVGAIEKIKEIQNELIKIDE